MALPPLPANNTGRVFVDYTTGRHPHTLAIRVNSGPVPAEIDEAVSAVLSPLMAVCHTAWKVTGTRVQLAGGVVTLPINLPETLALVGTMSGALLPEREEPRATTFLGRGPVSGRKVSLAVYGMDYETPPRYRIPEDSPSVPVGAALLALRLNGDNGVFVTIAHDAPVWYDYASVNYNSYWEAEVRG